MTDIIFNALVLIALVNPVAVLLIGAWLESRRA
jgi:hypothetical protein